MGVWVIYWDIDDNRGMGWPLVTDRVGEPAIFSLYGLIEAGWERI